MLENKPVKNILFLAQKCYLRRIPAGTGLQGSGAATKPQAAGVSIH